MSPDLAGRIVLITGASRGIGAAVARACAEAGASVVLTAKTRAALEEVDDQIRALGGNATLVPLDLTKGDQVDLLGAPLFQRFGRLDGFVACAADLGTLTPASHLDPPVMARVMAVNVLANQRLIRSLEPLLRASPSGRAVFATDRTQRNAAFWCAYAASKAALEALVLAWAAELQITPVKVNLIDPGPVATRLRAQAFPGEQPARLRQPEDVAPAFLKLLDPGLTETGMIVAAQSGS